MMLHTPSRAVAGTLYGSRQKTELSSLRRLSPWRIGSREQTPTEHGKVVWHRGDCALRLALGRALPWRVDLLGLLGTEKYLFHVHEERALGERGERTASIVRHDNFSQPISVSYTSIAERYMNVNREFFAWQKQPKLLQSSRKRSKVI